MSKCYVKNKCAFCGKELGGKNTIVVMADMKWLSETYPFPDKSRVKFCIGEDTRNAYCDVGCLRLELNQILDGIPVNLENKLSIN